MTAGLGGLQTAAFLWHRGDVPHMATRAGSDDESGSFGSFTPAGWIGGATGTCKQRAVAQRSSLTS